MTWLELPNGSLINLSVYEMLSVEPYGYPKAFVLKGLRFNTVEKEVICRLTAPAMNTLWRKIRLLLCKEG